MPYTKNIQPYAFIAGQVADSNPFSQLSASNTDTVIIPFGVAVKLDGATAGFKLPAATGDITNRMFIASIGQRVRSNYYDVNGNLVAADTYGATPGSSMSAYELGDIAVVVEEAVLPGDQVFIRFATGAGGTQLGAFRKSADTATATAHPSWFFLTGASAGGFAIVKVV
jgi:hypothetical protein